MGQPKKILIPYFFPYRFNASNGTYNFKYLMYNIILEHSKNGKIKSHEFHKCKYCKRMIVKQWFVVENNGIMMFSESLWTFIKKSRFNE